MPGNDDETLQDILPYRCVYFLPLLFIFSLSIVYFIFTIIVRYFLSWSFYYRIITPIIYY